MLSLSKNEFKVISFLIRNFSKRFTIRSIASSLEISAAGAHAALKKLERGRVVKVEKLGTGLFYDVNLDSKVARHLAAIALLKCYDLREIISGEVERESKIGVFDGKKLLVVTNNADTVKDICYKSFKDVELVCMNEGEFKAALGESLEKGNVIFGEELVVDMIKEVMR